MSQTAATPTPAAIPRTRPAISSPRRREVAGRRVGAWAASVSVSDTALVTQPGRLAVRNFAESSASGQAQVTSDPGMALRHGEGDLGGSPGLLLEVDRHHRGLVVAGLQPGNGDAG